MKVTVCRTAHFNAAHRIFNPEWDDQKNQDVFGKCSLPNYHGHNYNLTVKVTGEVNKDTGYVIDMKILKKIIQDNILERFDHRNLNLDVEEFKSLPPTAENIAIVTWDILRDQIDLKLGLKIILYETERNFVEYTGE
jgi:6-pyruvoyltetrahydropterin/6-carboxytetrahydropterin synthase